MLLVDHQTGLLSLVRDIDPEKFMYNVLALADLASYFKLPTILTTSFEDGPNGPLVPELLFSNHISGTTLCKPPPLPRRVKLRHAPPMTSGGNFPGHRRKGLATLIANQQL